MERDKNKSVHVHMAELLQQVLGLKLDVHKPNYSLDVLTLLTPAQHGVILPERGGGGDRDTQTEKEITSVNYIIPTSVSLSGYQTPAVHTACV